MSEGRGRFMWSQTSLLCAVIANAHSGKQGRSFKPKDFNPYESKQSQVIAVDENNIGLMKKEFKA